MVEADLRPVLKEFELGRFSEALLMLKRLTRQSDRDRRASHNVLLAELLQLTGANQQAREIVTEILDLDSANAIVQSRCHEVLGVVFFEEGQLEKSLHHFRGSVRVSET